MGDAAMLDPRSKQGSYPKKEKRERKERRKSTEEEEEEEPALDQKQNRFNKSPTNRKKRSKTYQARRWSDDSENGADGAQRTLCAARKLPSPAGLPTWISFGSRATSAKRRFDWL